MERTRCLIGLAIGDALGEKFEGLSSEEIRRRYGEIKDFISKKVRITDDTMLSILTAESIIEEGCVRREKIGEKFIENRERIKRTGPTTTKAIKRLEKDIKSISMEGTTDGAAMRAAPIGICSSEENILENTVSSSIVTHGTDIAISGACAISFAINAAISHDKKDMIIEASKEGARRGREYGTKTSFPKLEGLIERALSIPLEKLPEEIGVGIETHEAVPSAIAAFYQTKNAKEAILSAVNLGGDTDTIASMAGAIAGAFYKKVPSRWEQKIRERRKLRRMERKLLGLRPSR